MTRFRFQATDAAGGLVSGELDADDEAAAREQLERRGLAAPQITPLAAAGARALPSAGRLGIQESEEVLLQLAQLTSVSASLVEGLRAAASESPNRRVASTLRHLAREISRGRSLPDALANSASRMPAHVKGLVAAAARTGRLSEALDELIEHHRSVRAMSWSIWGSLAYPLTVFGLALLLLAGLYIWIVPQFAAMYADFGIKLPLFTQAVIATSRVSVELTSSGKWVLAIVVPASMLAFYLMATGRGGATVQRHLLAAPLVGPLWQWSASASFLQLLATLLDHEITLPDALRLTADAMRNAEFRRAGIWLADGVQSGRPLSHLVAISGCLPQSGVPVLRWGEQAGALAEAARTLSEMFAERVWARAAWLRSALPPLIYVFLTITIGFAIMSLLMPLFDLISFLA